MKLVNALSIIFLAAAPLLMSQQWQAYRSGEVTNKDGITFTTTTARLGGISNIFKLPGKGLFSVKCKGRGEGKAQLGVIGSHGWGYSNKLELNKDTWQDFEVEYYETAPQFTIRLYTVEDKQVKIELKDLTVTEIKLPPMGDGEVPPVCFEAEQHPGKNCTIIEDKDASGGHAVQGGKWYELAKLPVPLTSRPFYLYAKIRKEIGGKMHLAAGRSMQVIYRKDVPNAKGWQWVTVGPISAPLLYPLLMLTADGETDAKIEVDKLIITTQKDLQKPDDFIQNDKVSQGLATAAKAANAPVIDGNLDDDCWKAAIELTPFNVNDESRLATEQTITKFAWDDSNLYVSFKCLESCLVPAANRQHQFKNNITNNDNSDIWNQDCVLLIFQPDPSKNIVYDIAATPSGFITDSRMTGESIWETRDVSWNCNAKTAAKVQNGFWTLEMAVPLSSMNATTKQPWRFIAGRIEKASAEYSAWNMVSGGFHRLNLLGSLQFALEVPSIENIVFPSIGPGENAITFKAKEPVHFLATTVFDNDRPASFWNISPNKGNFYISQNGRFAFQWSISRPETLQPLLIFPKRKCSASSLALEFNVSGGEVRLNGQKAKSGNSLSTGINKLELISEKPVEGSFQAAGLSFNAKDGWIAKDGKLTRTILVEDTRVWPEWRAEGLVMAQNAYQELTMIPQGIEGFTLKDYTFLFDLPESFTFIGAADKYKHWSYITENAGKVLHDGITYNRTAIRFKKTVRFNPKITSWQTLTLLFKAPAKTGQKDFSIYYSSASAEAAITEVPMRIPVIMTAPLDGIRPPKTLLLQMWMGNWIGAMSEKTLYPYYVEHLAQMGISEAGFKTGSKKVDSFCVTGLESWCNDPSDFLAKRPDTQAIDQNGKPIKKIVCSTIMTTDPEWKTYFTDTLAPDFLKRNEYPAHINWDYEFPVFSTAIACFCPRCMKAFSAQFPEVPANITVDEIKLKFTPQWTRFMNERMAAIAIMFSDAYHKHQPEIAFSVYTGYQSKFTKEHYGVDWNLFQGKLDYAMCGYGRPMPELEDTRNAIGKTPFVVGIISNPYDMGKRAHPSCFTPAALARRLCDSTGGILLYAYNTLDARSFHSIARISKVMTEHEEYFVRHDVSMRSAVKVTGLNDSGYEILKGADGSLLVALINLKNKPGKVTVTLPEGYEKSTIETTIQPGDFIMEVIRKK